MMTHSCVGSIQAEPNHVDHTLMSNIKCFTFCIGLVVELILRCAVCGVPFFDFEVCGLWCSFLWYSKLPSSLLLSKFWFWFISSSDWKKKIDRKEKEGFVECQSSFFYGLGTTTSPTMAYDWGIKRILVGRVLLMDHILLGDTDSVYKFLIFLTWS